MSARLKSAANGEASILSWLYWQLFLKVPATPASIRLYNQTAVVTGAIVGLGFEVSRQLLTMGLSHLVIAVRSQVKGEAAAAQLQSKFLQAKIEISILDLGSYNSVVQFAQHCWRRLTRLDIAILNAGIMRQTFERNAYTKHESMVQVNYLSTALLAILLAPILKSKRDGSRPGRLTVVGSDMSHWASFPNPLADPLIPSLDERESFTSTGRYALTKLMEQLFVIKLSELLSPDDVVANLVNPGFCAGTSLGGESTSHSWISKFLVATVARTTADGARAYIDAVAVQGKKTIAITYPKIAYTPLGRELKEKLWRESLAEFELAGAAGIIEGLMKD